MPALTVRRLLVMLAILAAATLGAAIWLLPQQALLALGHAFGPPLEVNTTTYRGIVTVFIAAAGSLLALAVWTWTTRPRRSFTLPEGGEMPVDVAAQLVRAAIIARRDVRTVRVEVEHDGAGIRVHIAPHVTADARLVDVEDASRRSAAALATRLGLPLRSATVAIAFTELNLVASRARRAEPERARAA